MTAPDVPAEALVDAGLFAPVRAGTPIEAVVSDHAWLQAMLDAEAALARAQAKLGSMPPAVADLIGDAARAGRLDPRAVALAARETANPVVALVGALTAIVAAADPEAAGYVHLGSTSQDVLDTGLMLLARRALTVIRADLAAIGEALGDLAVRHRDTVMAGRTLALHAVPTTFGLKAAGWRGLVLDADERLARLTGGGLPVSLGGAAGTLAGYLAYADAAEGYHDRLIDAYAAETGLGRPDLPWHTLRTPMADLAAALAMTSGALGKIAVDVLTLARTEIGELREPGADSRGVSSAMPQKHNPVLATLVRSAALQVPAMATALTQSLLAEDERSAGGWQAEWSLLRECLRLTGGSSHTARELVEGLHVDPGRMRHNLDLTRGLVTSERLVAELTPLLGRAAAKKLVVTAAATAGATGRAFEDVLAENADLRRLVTPAQLAGWCDPGAYTGAAGALVDRLRQAPRAD